MNKKSHCDLCGGIVPPSELGGCLGFKFQDYETRIGLGICLDSYELGKICAFEDTQWFCKSCLSKDGFCLDCQKVISNEDRQKITDEAA